MSKATDEAQAAPIEGVELPQWLLGAWQRIDEPVLNDASSGFHEGLSTTDKLPSITALSFAGISGRRN